VVAGHRVTFATHGLAVLAGVLAGGTLAVRRSKPSGSVLLAAAVVTVAALVGAHALFRVLHPGGVGVWTGGLASMGGVAAALAAAWICAQLAGEDVAVLLDRLVPAGLLALAIGRIGCFLGGCCYGRPTTMPWGVVFPDLGPPAREPLQLYSAVADLALVALLLRLRGAPGTVARWGCIGFGLVRAALDTLRDPATADPLLGRLTLAQGAGLALALGAALAGRGFIRRAAA
jgi:phosphatidylglycerol:prolipoprotein diacylglycerol transferase